MTLVPFQDGDILTAGSLRLIPQFSTLQNYSYATYASGANYVATGSIFVSGNTFRHSLLCTYIPIYQELTSANTWISLRYLVSGAGLGGGSAIGSLDYSGFVGARIGIGAYSIVINSGAGWIPGSDAVVFIEAKSPISLSLLSQFSMWGKG